MKKDKPKSLAQVRQDYDVKDLKALSDRLQQRAFAWQHEDYFLLKRVLPELIANMELDFPILRIVDEYLNRGGEIKRQGDLICLVDKKGDPLAGGKNLKELLLNCVWTFA